MEASFIKSSDNYIHCPEPNKPEYAFIGRSNVGKSSLINMLVDKKNLAKTSQTPGKTQLINHFDIDDTWYLVDLPGYGFAKVSKTSRVKWEGMLREYIANRTNLHGLFVLIDSRHPPQRIDQEFLAWVGECQIPFVIVFTKIDKLSHTKLTKSIKLYEKVMLESWEKMPYYFLTSSEKGQGKEEIIDFIEELNQNYKAEPKNS